MVASALRTCATLCRRSLAAAISESFRWAGEGCVSLVHRKNLFFNGQEWLQCGALRVGSQLNKSKRIIEIGESRWFTFVTFGATQSKFSKAVITPSDRPYGVDQVPNIIYMNMDLISSLKGEVVWRNYSRPGE